MIYNIINPSDACTLESEDFSIAAAAVVLLGEGMYALESTEDHDLRTPIMDGWEEWFGSRGISDISEYVTENKLEVAKVLGSVVIGDVDARKLYKLQIKASDNPKQFRDDWVDKRCTSMNNICCKAQQYAAQLNRQE